MSDAAVQVVRDVYAAFGRGDLPAVLAACAEDVDWRCHAPSCAPFSGTFPGRAGVQTFFGQLLTSVQFTSFAPRTFLAEGESVVVLGHDTGIAIPTGRPYDVEWVQVITVRGGKIASFAEYLETAPVESAFRDA